MREALQALLENSSKRNVTEEILTFDEYLQVVQQEPWVTRDTFQLLHDMLLSSGVDHSINPGKPIKHHYHFF
jgi:hypothetical protein